jgi:phosphatidylinositol alpha-1,6-mannosyltransferase
MDKGVMSERTVPSLFITADFPPIVSGISTTFYNLLRYLPKQEHAVIAPWVKGGRQIDAGLSQKVYRIFMPLGDDIFNKSLRGILLFCYSLVVIKKEKIRILVCGQPVIIGFIGLLFKKILHLPYLVFVYGGEIVKFKESRMILNILRRVLAEADKVIVNSEFTLKAYTEFGIQLDKLLKLTPAVDTEIFRPNLKVSDLVEKYKLKDKRVILTVARLSERKGHDMVMNSLVKLRELFPGIIYLIVGTGPQQKRLKDLVRRNNLEGNVIFAGAIREEDLPCYYNLCEVYVMPNREVLGVDTLEGFGTSFIEASACAKPVIGGRSGGAYEAVSDGQTGYLIEPTSIDELAERIKALLLDTRLAQEMGQRGRQRIIKNFQWIERAKILENLIA